MSNIELEIVPESLTLIYGSGIGEHGQPERATERATRQAMSIIGIQNTEIE